MINLSTSSSIIFDNKEIVEMIGLTQGILWRKNVNLPYTQIPCIQAVGQCRINTGIMMNTNPVVEMTLQKNTDDNIVHGYYASSAGQSVKSTATNTYTIQDQWGSFIVGSNATQKQILTYSIQGTTATLSSSLGGSITRENVSIPSIQDFKFFANRPDSYASFGQGLLFDSRIYVDDVLVRDYVACINNETNELGIWDKVNDVFEGNDPTTTGHFIIPSEYAVQLMSLGVQPKGTLENQQQQLLDMGVENV